MLPWLRKEIVCTGSVLFRGQMPPRPERFQALGSLEMEVSPLESNPNCHWAAKLRHADWGEASLVCLRDPPRPPKEILDYDVGLTDAERDEIRRCDSSITLRMTGQRKNILQDRKVALRLMHAVMSDVGIAVVDHVSERFWSQGALENELCHDADLDITGIFTLHAVTDDEGENLQWLHSHGLAEIGFFDFDILEPSSDIGEAGYDLLRAIAFMIVEGRMGKSSGPVALASPRGAVQPVAVPEFSRKAGPRYVELRDDPDNEHEKDRIVLCEPRGGLLGRWRSRVRPSKFLSRPLDEGGVIHFSSDASALMAQRARNTYSMFRTLTQELDEFELPTLAKVGYRTDGGAELDVEHLWFEVHELFDNELEATLLNEPHAIARMHAGQRGRHSVESLSDWQIFTPVGTINPRQTTAARIIRHNRDAFREAMRQAQEEEAED
jgi:hypothetical protein